MHESGGVGAAGIVGFDTPPQATVGPLASPTRRKAGGRRRQTMLFAHGSSLE